MSTTQTTRFATERQIAFGQKNGLAITPNTPYDAAYQLVGQHIAANPLSPEEVEARKQARKAALEATPASEKQVALISKITKGKFVPTNQWQAQGFFGARRNRQRQTAAA